MLFQDDTKLKMLFWLIVVMAITIVIGVWELGLKPLYYLIISVVQLKFGV